MSLGVPPYLPARVSATVAHTLAGYSDLPFIWAGRQEMEWFAEERDGFVWFGRLLEALGTVDRWIP
jgi:hypothetical protein